MLLSDELVCAADIATAGEETLCTAKSKSPWAHGHTGSAVDELITDRRAEAARENCD
jgi:hypothetical protein